MQTTPEPSTAGPRKRPIICYVTDRSSLNSAEAPERLLAQIRAAMAAGADWVQIRERNLPARELLALAKGAVQLAPTGVRVIVNDRLDIAIAAGSAGVHLGEESLSPSEVVGWRRAKNAPADFSVGVSCHSLARAREAEAGGASYIFFGPVFETPAKMRFGPPQGRIKLEEVCRAVKIPVIAIGGVNETNGEDCLRMGAAGIAAIRMFQEPRDPEALKAAVERLHRLR